MTRPSIEAAERFLRALWFVTLPCAFCGEETKTCARWRAFYMRRRGYLRFCDACGDCLE